VAEFLLEVGCEEIPAGWLQPITAELGQRFTELAAAEHLKPEKVETHSTPRRLVLRADVLARQADRKEDVWGPALKAAKDASGKWTPAALGFAKKCGVAPEQLETGTKAGGKGDEQLLFLKSVAGREAGPVLAGVIAATLRGLSFPKRMSWDAWLDDGKGAFPFGRPIRWLVSLLDGTVVPFTIYELVGGAKGRVIVEAAATTRGHRFFPRGSRDEAPRVRSFAELRATLRDRFVLLARADRQAQIRRGLADVEREIGSDHGLLEDWADLVEHPAVAIGRVPAEFQGLPREVLETVLVHHQKYIPLLADGHSVSRFAAVTDADGKSAEAIARGMERVVVARLRDAAFFFREDQKRPLRDRLADLAGVTFHVKLGSYKDKADRVVRLVDAMGALGLVAGAQQQAARDAALLAKVDLTTLMVREFTELQGVMGGIYLRAQGAPASVASAVEWHYHPVSIDEDAAPAGKLEGDALAVFAAVSLADKLDTLAGYFGLGLQPTGSSDPYGLRRAAQGAVRVLLDFWPSAQGKPQPSLVVLAGRAVEGYGAAMADAGAAKAALSAFLLERLRYVLAARGFAADEVDAVLGAREPDALDDLKETRARLEALRSVRSEAREDFEHLATAFKRAANILDQAKEPRAPEVQPRLFEGDAERALFEAVQGLSGHDGGYESRLRALATLREPVDRFFDPQRGVFVMTDNDELRRNRLALLDRMRKLFYRIADISKLGG
jgi:glycyl-tRNA synthetase beta chain